MEFFIRKIRGLESMNLKNIFTHYSAIYKEIATPSEIESKHLRKFHLKEHEAWVDLNLGNSTIEFAIDSTMIEHMGKLLYM